MDITKAVIPVAGLGTRLLPATKSQPKEMLPVGKKPVVQCVVEELARSDVNQILFVTGKGKTSIENHFDEDAALVRFLRETGREDQLAELDFGTRGVEFFYTRQDRPRGLGHAIGCARHFVGEHPFVVALGDSIIGLNGSGSDIVRRLMDVFREKHAGIVIAFHEVPPEAVSRYGIARPAEEGDVFRIEDLVEKPARAEAPSRLAICARYLFTHDIFGAIDATEPGVGGEIQVTDAIRRLIREGTPAYGVKLTPGEQRYDIGNIGSYFSAFMKFALADPQWGAGLRDELRRLLDDRDA
jgi:UTP--glucose-1-phosphate uridylyltransferase